MTTNTKSMCLSLFTNSINYKAHSSQTSKQRKHCLTKMARNCQTKHCSLTITSCSLRLIEKGSVHVMVQILDLCVKHLFQIIEDSVAALMCIHLRSHTIAIWSLS